MFIYQQIKNKNNEIKKLKIKKQNFMLFKQKLISYADALGKAGKHLNTFSSNRTKWSNTLKQFVGCCGRIA